MRLHVLVLICTESFLTTNDDVFKGLMSLGIRFSLILWEFIVLRKHVTLNCNSKPSPTQSKKSIYWNWAAKMTHYECMYNSAIRKMNIFQHSNIYRVFTESNMKEVFKHIRVKWSFHVWIRCLHQCFKGTSHNDQFKGAVWDFWETLFNPNKHLSLHRSVPQMHEHTMQLI